MITEEKIQEVRRLLKRGMPEGELREMLLKEGFTNDDLKIVFKPQPYDMRAWYLFFGSLISLAGFYFFFENGSLLILILGALLFVAYFFEVKRQKQLKNSEDDLTGK
jgi:hypothetical protein